MKQFLKDNIALVAAIALPALLAVIFGLSTLFVNASVEDPKNDFLIITDYYAGNTGFQFNVNNEKLTVSYNAPEKDAQGNPIQYSGKPRFWRVHVPEMSVEEIALNEPANRKTQDISIPGITDAKVVNLSPGPDGYTYVNSYNYGGNIMTEIFMMDGRRHRSAGIAKDGRFVSFKIPNSDNYYAYNSDFIGWIIEE